MNDVIGIQERLERIYRLYVESAFPLRYPGLAAERRRLLEMPGTLSQPALVEPVPTYPGSGLDLQAAASRLGPAYRDLPDLAGPLFPAGRTLYEHQWQALEQSLAGKDVVVTTGTGSGKTESFMLPLLATLAAESRSWSAPSLKATDREWWRGKSERVSQWAHDTRPHAIRGLILYPLNALVEDQLRRLRSVLDSPEVTAWMDRERGGNRITFGRYTSLAPLAGPPDTDRIERLRTKLREREAEWNRVRETLQQKGDGSEYHFSRMDGGELWSRWDAQDSPPDLLITNYSMLNIMLMRALEQGIFDQTREWLADNPSHQFYLIVDELHAYRGTAGTEVSYILRLLFDRLGLTPDSSQLRILATSASLDSGESGRQFLSEFFGRSPDHFEVISSRQDPPARAAHLDEYGERFVHFAEANPAAALDSGETPISSESAGELATALGSPTDLRTALLNVGLSEALRAACWDGTGTRATLSTNLATRLFPTATEPQSALRGALLALGSTENLQPVRAHLFFQNMQNLWVCVKPGCGRQDEGPLQAQVGRTHATHRLTCDCGSRVLDLIVCEVCGEVFLGAHRTRGKDQLSADRSDLEGIPDQLDQRSYGRYAVVWPVENFEQTPVQKSYTWQGKDRRWQMQYLERPTGRLLAKTQVGRVQAEDDLQPVWTYTISSQSEGDADQQSAFPPVCPACDTDYRRREVLPTPLRHHRSGFQKAAQVLASTLMREVEPEKRKLVIFSDSRQDAARLAAGMERDHFRDMVRVALLETLRGFSADLEAAVRFNSNLVPALKPAALERLGAINPLLVEVAQQPVREKDEEAANRFISRPGGAPFLPGFLLSGSAPEPQLDDLKDLLRQYPSRIPLSQLRDAVFEKLVMQGICPGGNSMEALNYTEGNNPETPWHAAFTWSKGSVIPCNQPQARAHAQQLGEMLLAEMMMVLFTHQVRTLESIGQGRVTAPLTGVTVNIQEATDALVRFLAVKRRYANSEFVEPGTEATFPGPVQKYLSVVQQDEEQIRQKLLASQLAETSRNGLIVRADNLVLIGGAGLQGMKRYRCQKCRALYLHRAAGHCIHCGGTLVEENVPASEIDQDYYAYLAREQSQSFRLNAEELTGQTDSESRTRRQRRFQEVFLEDENAKAQGIDLLSVTTTMEAGVDIGALNAVMMSNMPPRRFNYQQRVGRAGRRGDSLSLAVTLCRGRTHDSYYYARPEAITGDSPPPPYVDTSSATIYRRVLIKEILRQAIGNQQAVTTDSVHGEFGTVEEWLNPVEGQPGRRERLVEYLSSVERQRKIRDLAGRLATQTRLDDTALQNVINQLRDLPVMIDEVASDPKLIQDQLSERLAYAGLLPMFGFPTRTRLMFLDPLTSINGQNFPPRNVVDRDLDLAISAFAPGAEIVRDKRVHTALGVVNLHPAPRGQARTSPGLYPPLEEDNPRPLGVCSHCRAIHEDELLAGQVGSTVECPTCGESSLRVLDAREPRHFYSTGKPRNYNGFFEIRGFTSRPTLAVMNGEEVTGPFNAVLTAGTSSQQNEVLTFNDYSGRGGFDFRPDPMRTLKGAYMADLEAKPSSQRTGGSKRITLLSRRRTDTLGVRIREWPAGHQAPPDTVEGRAAWYSLAFALRDAAAVMFDIEGSELDGGLYVNEGPGQPEASAFLSDRLENGAGYASRLGQPEEFFQLLQQLNTTLREKWTGHVRECDASCARCLRDYTNLSFHPILDWRMALDMGSLLADANPLELHGSHWEMLYQGAESPIQNSLEQLMFQPVAHTGSLPIFAGFGKQKGKTLVIRHPLWSQDHPQILAAQEIAHQYGEVRDAVSPFMLLRRPSDAL